MVDQYLATNINGPRRTTTITATSQLTEDADLVIANTTGLGAALTATLPDARAVDGREIIIKAPVATVASGGQNVVVAGLGAQTIDGAASVTLAVDQTALTVKSDNANWRIVALTDADSGGEIIFGDLFLDAASPTLTIGNGTGSPELVLNKSDAGTATFDMNVVGVTRWDWLFAANEDLSLERRSAAGVLQDVPILFDAAAGNASFANSILQGGAVVADGAPDATNAIFGDGSGDAGITLFVDATGFARFAATDTAGTQLAELRHDFNTNTWEFESLGSHQYSMNGSAFWPQNTTRDLGTTSNHWGVGFIDQVQYGVQTAGDGATVSLGGNKLVNSTAPTGITTLNLPSAAIGNDYFIDVIDNTNAVNVVAAAGDSINGGAAAGTAAITAAPGLYHIYAISTSDWRLHGPISIGPASA